MSYGSTIKVPFGPQHPALKEPEYFLFEIDGDIVVNVKPRIGYVHRGIEKAFEANTYFHNIYLAERICGICCHAHTTCYTQAVEGLIPIEIPPRAAYIRVIMAELERLHSHSLWVGIAAHEAGYDTMFMYMWKEREIIMDLMEEISGNRVTHAMNTIGGVRRDITDEQVNKLKKFLNIFENNIKQYIKALENEPTFIKRTKEVGILKPSDAIATCAIGPTLRASGIKNDVRKDDPYLVYDEIPFNIITNDGCDVFARTIVRCEEMIESANIIRYCLDHMPKGEIKVKVPRTFPPNESLGRVEAPRGELIHYTRSNGTAKPERHKVRSPTLGNLLSVCKTLIGAHIADIPLILAGIDPCFSCMDRIIIKKV
ncbi:MAG: nickel-dependent hydrogenase large subunit [Candidatus Methanomethylicaceae archaeon]|nr:nickel-dependent hydrogenase large subunit [Candidatus Verstraetearchaeota archaeon]